MKKVKNKMYKQYTMGIIKEKENDEFVFVQKIKPSYLKGKLVFPGGKIEPDETKFQCIIREIEEEIGIKTNIFEWFSLATFYFRFYSLDVLFLERSISKSDCFLLTDTKEPIIFNSLKNEIPENLDPLCREIIKEVYYKYDN